ncbi:MAG TPA: terminase large subunit [Aggregatilinea sp.]|uniref:terminase TerL endonuclease subunit n=1 Tax=Aggregatilinea sp. TaxID=2806333 RepID=UPI002CCB0EDE|nr:terminase TerL endonuclease subunit [Aggregatilinea sp.]HML23555.1 terminase large subunit [Aggregatilinea sp.]
MTLTAEALVDRTLARLGLKPAVVDPHVTPPPDIVEWAEECFYIPETRRPIRFQPHQKTLLRLMTQLQPDPVWAWRFAWTTLMWSTIKKSGKTAISALYARWAAETWGPFQEIYNLGNKLQQAQARAFKRVKMSILLSPPAVQDRWEMTATKLLHKPSGSEITALPINDAGEAGSNQSLTVWTELWGFQYEEALRMWDEMQPVPTRPLSQRFVDTYAGYEGESELLWSLWQLALNEGVRLDDDLPVYGVPAAGLIAYIDTGEAARRMPWQQGEAGRTYYANQKKIERPHNYDRLHNNFWTSSVNALIQMAVWDRLIYERGRVSDDVPVWLAADAAVSGDSMALMAVTVMGEVVIELETWIWEPPKGGKLDYDETLLPAVEAALQRYRVMGVAYDEYQLHSDMTRLAKRHQSIPFFAFPQGAARVLADTHFVKRVHEGRFRHTGNTALRQHVQNADGKEQLGGEAIRIVKRTELKKIDAAVTASMASEYATELWEHAETVYDESVRVRIDY